MTKFKVGDRVECTQSRSNYKNGDQFIVNTSDLQWVNGRHSTDFILINR